MMSPIDWNGSGRPEEFERLLDELSTLSGTERGELDTLAAAIREFAAAAPVESSSDWELPAYVRDEMWATVEARIVADEANRR